MTYDNCTMCNQPLAYDVFVMGFAPTNKSNPSCLLGDFCPNCLLRIGKFVEQNSVEDQAD